MVVVGQGVKEIDVLGERFVSGTKHMMRERENEIIGKLYDEGTT